MRTIDCEQGSREWLEARAGRITASRMADVMDFTKKGDSGADRKNYLVELVAERLSGRAVDKFVTKAMKDGTEREPDGKTEYEIATNVMLDNVGFVLHPTLNCAGASPDGLVGEEGGLEVKCPTMTTHIKWKLAGVVPPEHEPQMMWNMACTGRLWWDFISFCPLFPEPHSRFIVRLHRSNERIDELFQQVVRFDGEVKKMIDALNNVPLKVMEASCPTV